MCITDYVGKKGLSLILLVIFSSNRFITKKSGCGLHSSHWSLRGGFVGLARLGGKWRKSWLPRFHSVAATLRRSSLSALCTVPLLPSLAFRGRDEVVRTEMPSPTQASSWLQTVFFTALTEHCTETVTTEWACAAPPSYPSSLLLGKISLPKKLAVSSVMKLMRCRSSSL